MSSPRAKRTKIFISYSHQDSDWLKRLGVHLRPLERDLDIELWDDTRISPGSTWREEIENAIASCRVAVLLVSADFLASDFIATNELPPLLNAAKQEGAVILPVILSPSRFLRLPSLSRFQSVNEPSRPLINLNRGEQEEVLDKVAQRIESIFQVTAEEVSQRNDIASNRNDSATVVASQGEENSRSNLSNVAASEIREPRFLAEFVKNSKGELRLSGKKGNHYEIRLFIKDAPSGTRKVIYELHETYLESIREVLRGRRDFEEHITSHGDFIIKVTMYGDSVTKMSDWLSSALQNNYGDSASDEILYAIKQLEER